MHRSAIKKILQRSAW